MKKITILLVLTPLLLLGQIQIGQDIVGEEINRQSGTTLSVSNDGSRVAITTGSDNNGMFGVGSVRVFDIINDNWQQRGQVIFGDAAGNFFGKAMDLSGDGNFLIASSTANDNAGNDAGLVRVFQLVNDTWMQVGDDLTGSPGSQFGTWVSITDDGSIIATGFNQQVTVYQFINGEWILRGNPIFNLSPTFTAYGRTIELTNDGSHIAIGATENDEAGTNAGQVRVFEFINDDWTQMGENINGDQQNALFANTGTMAIADDGTTLMIGMPRKLNPSGVNTGAVNIYTFTNGDWVLDEELFGDNDADNFGRSVSTNSEGNMLAVSSPNGTGFGSITRLFKNEGGWAQTGEDIIDSDNFSPRNNALSGNGEIVAIGSPFSSNPSNSQDTNVGITRVFSTAIEVLAIQDNKASLELKIYPNPVENTLYFKRNGNANVNDVTIIDQVGKIIISQKNVNEIDLSALRTGIYIVSLTIDTEVINTKFIKR